MTKRACEACQGVGKLPQFRIRGELRAWTDCPACEGTGIDSEVFKDAA